MEWGLWSALAGLTAVSALGALMPIIRIRATDWAPAFALGGVAATLVFHLVPEAVASGPSAGVFFVLGLTLWLVVARKTRRSSDFKATAQTYLVGDGIHNFLDGGALALAFSQSPAHGAWLAVAVLAHEITQEWAEWALLLHAGFEPKKILAWNSLASASAFVGAALVLYVLPEGALPRAGLNGLLTANFVFVLARLKGRWRPCAWVLAGFLAAAVPHWLLGHGI
ncbi:MAG: ZIP family metal transporter [Bacteroidia bacterium]|nr:ZIP family metal transporter [Bacteroidia bacterium]MDW8333470.1 ZIP family metal transporter [Bacteroidia bacterium]